MTLDLANRDIQYLTGVGPKRAELLRKQFDIRSFRDLLYYFPFRYVDRSRIYKISELEGEGAYIQLRGRFISFQNVGEGARRRRVGLFVDGTGAIEVLWFNGIKRIQESVLTGTDYVLFGRVSIYQGRHNMAHPEVEKFAPEAPPKGLQGVYNITEQARNRGFQSRSLQQLVWRLLDLKPAIPETLTPDIIARHNLMPLAEAIYAIHRPTSLAEVERARMRLKFDELFYLQLNILRYSRQRSRSVKGFTFDVVGQPFNDFYRDHLPFPLTGAQKRVVREIRNDMRTGRQMNRLLQGDVGSGKTLVAFLSMLIAIGNGYQACIMAPTEILASQHFDTISELASGIGLNVKLLTGSTRKKEREAIDAALRDGSLHILIGTHALIEDKVVFRNLGLAVIDEQHRFGVAQRAKMWRKNVVPPHVLVMTATPIPRTLAMTVYGDLDVSVIDELPPGRKPVATIMRYESSRDAVDRFVGQQLREGRQAYIVYPLIHESEKLDLHDVEMGYERICETFPSYKAALVHGQLKPAAKDYQMQLFASGEARILVATLVIEVGVNVPNATVMVIENAERFGLATLHQLRGRVGRGADQSYCILMTKQQIAKDTRRRLTLMTETTDGFVIAEEDMKMRGPGDMEGTMQSGIAFDLKISNLATDGQIIQLARDTAQAIIDADPTLALPEHRLLADTLTALYSRQINWGLIS